MINGYMKNRSLIKELLELDLRDTFSKIKIPYKIIQGDTDIVTSTRTVENFLSENENENIRFVKVKNSGQMGSGEAMKRIVEEIVKMTEE